MTLTQNSTLHPKYSAQLEYHPHRIPPQPTIGNTPSNRNTAYTEFHSPPTILRSTGIPHTQNSIYNTTPNWYTTHTESHPPSTILHSTGIPLTQDFTHTIYRPRIILPMIFRPTGIPSTHDSSKCKKLFLIYLIITLTLT